MDVWTFGSSASRSSRATGLKPIVSPTRRLARGPLLGLLFLLAAVLPPPAIADDVMLGRKGGSPLSWNPVTEYPLSDHVHFRVNVPQNATSGEFTVNHPDGSVEHLGGIFCMFGTQRAFTTGLEFTGCCLDDEWSVSCVVHCGQSGDLTFGPTSFDVRNLSVVQAFLSEAEPEGSVSSVMPFAAVLAPGASAQLGAVLDDGYEVLSPGADPEVWVVDVTVDLIPIAAGAPVSVTLSHDFDGSGGSVSQWVQGLVPGLYYFDAHAHERMLSAPSGGPDSAQAYSNSLVLASVGRGAYTSEDVRKGSFGLLLVFSDPSPWVIPTAGTIAVRQPDGALDPASGSSMQLPCFPINAVTTPELDLRLAEHYDIGITYKDSGGTPHDSSPRWCVPKPAGFDVRACADYWGGELSHAEEEAQFGYTMLGCVRDVGPPDAWSVYSGRSELGKRGGVVAHSAPEVVSNFVAALREDQVIHYVGHACHHHWSEVPPPGHEIGEDPTSPVVRTLIFDTGKEVWPGDIPTRGEKALLVYANSCTLLGTTWKDPYNPPEEHPIVQPPIGQVIADRCARAFIGWQGLGNMEGADMLDSFLWPNLTKYDLGILDALTTALTEAEAATNHQWMIDHCLLEPDGSPRVVVAVAAGDEAARNLHLAYTM